MYKYIIAMYNIKMHNQSFKSIVYLSIVQIDRHKRALRGIFFNMASALLS